MDLVTYKLPSSPKTGTAHSSETMTLWLNSDTTQNILGTLTQCHENWSFINLSKLNNLQQYYQYKHFHYQKNVNVKSQHSENKVDGFTNLQVLEDHWAKMINFLWDKHSPDKQLHQMTDITQLMYYFRSDQ
jgi:hypothetical protein